MRQEARNAAIIACLMGFAFMVGAAAAYSAMQSTDIDRIIYDATTEAIEAKEVHPYTCDCSYEATVVTELIQSLANKNDEVWNMYLSCLESRGEL